MCFSVATVYSVGIVHHSTLWRTCPVWIKGNNTQPICGFIRIISSLTWRLCVSVCVSVCGREASYKFQSVISVLICRFLYLISGHYLQLRVGRWLPPTAESATDKERETFVGFALRKKKIAFRRLKRCRAENRRRHRRRRRLTIPPFPPPTPQSAVANGRILIFLKS